MYLSYSGWNKLKCPLAYWHSYIGRTPTSGVNDRLGSIFGSVVGKLFERFYNDQLYRQPVPREAVLALVNETISSTIKYETTDDGEWHTAGVLLWKGTGEGKNPKAMYVNVDELTADVRDTVIRGLKIIRHYRLLGKDARAEVKLDSVIEGHKLGGRTDIMMRRVKPDNDEVILDGKGSRWRDAYVDTSQLKWYAMLFRRQFQRLPDRLGFIFWRYEPPKSVDWLEVTEAEVDRFQGEVLASIRRVEELEVTLGRATAHEDVRKVFLPIAGNEAARRQDIEQECRFCPFATDEICPEGRVIAQRLGRR